MNKTKWWMVCGALLLEAIVITVFFAYIDGAYNESTKPTPNASQTNIRLV